MIVNSASEFDADSVYIGALTIVRSARSCMIGRVDWRRPKASPPEITGTHIPIEVESRVLCCAILRTWIPGNLGLPLLRYTWVLASWPLRGRGLCAALPYASLPYLTQISDLCPAGWVCTALVTSH